MLAVVLAATTWYTYTYRSDPPTLDQRLLAYIPSDTIFLAGRTRSPPTESLVGTWRSFVQPLAAMATAFDPRHAATEGGSAAGILAALAKRLATSVEGEEGWLFDLIGMPRDGVVAAYTAAGIPVVRWQLADPRALWRTLNTAEQAAGVLGRTEARDGLRMRRYSFGSADSRRLELIVASGDGFGLITLDVRGVDNEALGQALGVVKPLVSFSAADLDTMAAAYGLIPGSVGFIDTKRLFNALSGAPGEHLDDLVDGFTATPGATNWLFSALDDVKCRETTAAITDFWPRTVFGVPALEGNNSHISLRLVGEIANQDRLATLNQLRGHVPEIAQSRRSVLAVGLGLNGATLQPVVEGLKTRLKDFSVSCEIFPDIQRRMADAAAAALELVGNVLSEWPDLAHIKGVAAGLIRVETGSKPSVPNAADGVLMIATEEPRTIRRLIRSATSADADTRPELHGDAVRLLAPPAAAGSQSVRVALREHGVAMLLGNATLPKHADTKPQPLVPNGLLVLRYDGGILAHDIKRATESLTVPEGPEAGQALIKIAELLRATDLAFNVSVDVVEAGVNVDVRATPAD